MNMKRTISLAMYKLKREYGEAVTITRRTALVTSVTAGTSTPTESTTTVKRAIVLRGALTPVIRRELGGLQIYGGVSYDATKLRVIFDTKRDLASGWRFDRQTDKLTIDDKDWYIEEIVPTDHDKAVMLIVGEVTNES